MRYSQPNILSTLSASAAIQNGTGRTSQGLNKQSINSDNPMGSNPAASFSTTSAYEADE